MGRQDHVVELILIDVILLETYLQKYTKCLSFLIFIMYTYFLLRKIVYHLQKRVRMYAVASRHPIYINAHVRASLLLSFHIVVPMFFLFARRVSRIRRPRRAHNLARTSAGCHFNCPMIGSGYRSACPLISRTIGLPEISFLPVHRTHRFQLIL